MGTRRALAVVTALRWRTSEGWRPGGEGESNAALATAAGVSPRTIRKAKAIVRAGLAEAVANGEMSPDKAYRHATKRHCYERSVVYFLRAGRFVKIGLAAYGDVQHRIDELQTGCPYELALLAVTPGTREDERALHQRFAALRARQTGEWFCEDGELLAYIERLRSTPIAS